jgi:hypothetical protein
MKLQVEDRGKSTDRQSFGASLAGVRSITFGSAG